MVVSLSQRDATVDELGALAGTVTIQALSDVGVPVTALNANRSDAWSLARDATILVRQEIAAGRRYQWVAYRTRAPAGARAADGWCVIYIDSIGSRELNSTCGPLQGEFSGTAQIVAGAAMGIAAADVTAAWFVVDGVRVDAALAPLGEAQTISAAVPLGDRVSLHLLRGDGEEVAGVTGVDMTTMCVGCPPPVIAPDGWVNPIMTPTGIVVPSTSTP
jgi:hypothetical protein